MNRKQRRILQKGMRQKTGTGLLGQATKDLKAAVKNLDKVGDLDGTILEIRQLMDTVGQTLDQVGVDFEGLQQELEAQRQINIRLLTILAGKGMADRDLNAWSDSDLNIVQALEASLREKYLAAREAT